MKEKSKTEILTELYNTHFVKNYAFKVSGRLDKVFFEDIVGELYLFICELPEDLIVGIYNKCGINCFRQYVSGIIVKQLRSKNSVIYRKYKKDYNTTIPLSSILQPERTWEENERPLI